MDSSNGATLLDEWKCNSHKLANRHRLTSWLITCVQSCHARVKTYHSRQFYLSCATWPSPRIGLDSITLEFACGLGRYLNTR